MTDTLAAEPATSADMPVFHGLDDAGILRLRSHYRATGTAVLGPPALSPALHAALLDEARRQLDADSWSLTGSRDKGEIDQNNQRARLGPVARSYLSSQAAANLLLATTGERLAPSWSATCFTRYIGPGQHMGEHCDKPETCAFNILTYLDAAWPEGRSPSPGLQLFVFRGDNSATDLVAQITAHANRAVVLNGARQAHLRPPLADGESLIMLAGCFQRT